MFGNKRPAQVDQKKYDPPGLSLIATSSLCPVRTLAGGIQYVNQSGRGRSRGGLRNVRGGFPMRGLVARIRLFGRAGDGRPSDPGRENALLPFGDLRPGSTRQKGKIVETSEILESRWWDISDDVPGKFLTDLEDLRQLYNATDTRLLLLDVLRVAGGDGEIPHLDIMRFAKHTLAHALTGLDVERDMSEVDTFPPWWECSLLAGKFATLLPAFLAVELQNRIHLIPGIDRPPTLDELHGTWRKTQLVTSRIALDFPEHLEWARPMENWFGRITWALGTVLQDAPIVVDHFRATYDVGELLHAMKVATDDESPASSQADHVESYSPQLDGAGLSRGAILVLRELLKSLEGKGSPVSGEKTRNRVKRREAENLIAGHLIRRPHDTANAVSEAVGCSKGVVIESPGWKANRRRLKDARAQGKDPIALPLADYLTPAGDSPAAQCRDQKRQQEAQDEEIDARERDLSQRVGEYRTEHPKASLSEVARAVGCTAGDVEHRQAELERLIAAQKDSQQEDDYPPNGERDPRRRFQKRV
ncbi:MAG: hypothetical protein HQ567_32415 [Candidatus Nealsonbacteria bacterium]|nr:hypothetical protein [Candidatus Nealsonbacteria bacterium]